jgi:hypothetical protein
MTQKRKDKECAQEESKRLKKKQTSISTFFKVTPESSLTSSQQSSTQESEVSESSKPSPAVKTEEEQVLIKQEWEEDEVAKSVELETIDEEELCSFVQRRSLSVDVAGTAAGAKECINEKEEEKEFKREATEEAEEEEKVLFYSSSIYTDHVDDILETVLDGEAHLFDKEELDLFDRFKHLDGKKSIYKHTLL